MNAITLKALVWAEQDQVFKSPSLGHAWPRDDWMRASCSRHSYEEILNPAIPVRMDDYEVEKWPCECGLYGATELKRVLRYKWSHNNLIFAMESRGNYEAWTGGLRSQDMRPIAIVSEPDWGKQETGNPLGDYMQVLHKGCNYFTMNGRGLEVVPLSFVKTWMKETWEQGEIGEYHGDTHY